MKDQYGYEINKAELFPSMKLCVKCNCYYEKECNEHKVEVTNPWQSIFLMGMDWSINGTSGEFIISTNQIA